MGKLSKVLSKINEVLDMREAARMQRAKDAGFHENTLFHGTAAKPTTTLDDGNIFDEFKLWEGKDPTRSTVNSEVSKLGVSLAEQPAVAEDFASLASRNGSEGSTLLPLRFRSDKTGSIDLQGDELNSDIYGSVVDSWRDGYDAIQFNNYTTPQGKKGSFVLVKDPSQIRSVNAAFDPAKKDSANLLAGLGGAGILGASMLTPEQVEASEMLSAQDNDRITADEFPVLEGIGGFLEDIEAPIPLFERPLQGFGSYLRHFGEPRSLKQRVLGAIDASPI